SEHRPRCDNGAQPEPRASPNRTRGGCSYGSEHAPGYSRLRDFCVGAPPPVRKRTPAITPSQPQSHPGRVLLQSVTPGGDPAQSTIAAAQPKAISGRLQCRKVGTTVSQIWCSCPAALT